MEVVYPIISLSQHKGGIIIGSKINIKMKMLLIVFIAAISLAVGMLAANFFAFSITNQQQKILSFNAFLQAIQTDNRHMMLFVVFTASSFAALCYVSFYKRSISTTRSDMMRLTPAIEIPVPAGQKQYGSARFTTPAEQDKAFCPLTLSFTDNNMAAILAEGEADYREMANKNTMREPLPLNLPNALIKTGGIPVSFDQCKHAISKLRLINGDVHTVTFGATRCGKSRTLVIPSICTYALAGYDMLNSDPKGELYQYTFPTLIRLGYQVYALDFKNPKKSSHINFLQFIIDAIEKDNISLAIQCCWDFVDGLVPEPKGSMEPLWTNGEKALLAASVMMVVYDNSIQGLSQQYPYATEVELTEAYYTKHKQYQNCTNVFNFLSKMATQNPQTKNLWLEDIINVLPDDHPSKLIMAIAESAPSKIRGSFITSALTTLRLFTDPNIAAMTADTDDGLLEMGLKKAIFMIVPDSKKTYYALASLFVNQYYQYVADYADSLGGRLPRNIQFNLDEFGNFTKIPDFETKMTVGAGRGIHFNLYLQSREQLIERYGKEVASIVLDNCHHWIYLKSGTDTCKMFEEKLNKYTVLSTSASASVNDSGGLSTVINSGSSSTSTQLMARSLLMADEIAKIERPYILVCSDNGYPSLMQSPDLHKWDYNLLLGLGDENHNTKVRCCRENSRPVRPVSKLNLWDFKTYISGLLCQFTEIEDDDQAMLQEIADQFSDDFNTDSEAI